MRKAPNTTRNCTTNTWRKRLISENNRWLYSIAWTQVRDRQISTRTFVCQPCLCPSNRATVCTIHEHTNTSIHLVNETENDNKCFLFEKNFLCWIIFSFKDQMILDLHSLLLSFNCQLCQPSLRFQWLICLILANATRMVSPTIISTNISISSMWICRTHWSRQPSILVVRTMITLWARLGSRDSCHRHRSTMSMSRGLMMNGRRKPPFLSTLIHPSWI